MAKHRALTFEIVKIGYLDWALQTLELHLHTISNESFEICKEHKIVNVSFRISSEKEKKQDRVKILNSSSYYS